MMTAVTQNTWAVLSLRRSNLNACATSSDTAAQGFPFENASPLSSSRASPSISLTDSARR
jgi:hypothetical protein